MKHLLNLQHTKFLNTVIRSKSFIALNACIIASGLWYITSQDRIASVTWNVPLLFYNVHNRAIQAPEFITLTIAAHKKALQQLLPTTLAVHINADEYSDGQQYIITTPQDLLLSNEYTVIQPAPIICALSTPSITLATASPKTITP